jgi:hypothetical protein
VPHLANSPLLKIRALNLITYKKHSGSEKVTSRFRDPLSAPRIDRRDQATECFSPPEFSKQPPASTRKTPPTPVSWQNFSNDLRRALLNKSDPFNVSPSS